MEERLKSHYESLARVIWFIRLADAKAAPVLVLQVALVGTLVARIDKLQSIAFGENGNGEQAALIFIAALYVLLVLAAGGMAAWVYKPRHGKTGSSLIYFEDIAANSLDDFRRKAKVVSEEDIEDQLLQQIHTVSQIASSKMRKVDCAFVLSGLTVVLWLVLLGWGSI